MTMTDLQNKFDDEIIKINGYTFRLLLKRSADFGIENYMALQVNNCWLHYLQEHNKIHKKALKI
jgi:hypothetical protein